MRFAPLTYRIDDRYIGSRPVTGYAIELPAPFRGLRFCARNQDDRWIIDHYDSGLFVHAPLGGFGADPAAIEESSHLIFDNTSRDRCVKSLVAFLNYLVGTDQLRPIFERPGYGWCADEALDVMAAYWGRLKDDEHKFSAVADAHGKHWHDVLDQLRQREAYFSLQRDWKAVALQVGTPVI